MYRVKGAARTKLHGRRKTEDQQVKLQKSSTILLPFSRNPLEFLRVRLNPYSIKPQTTEADCSSILFASASTRITHVQVLDHAGARAQSPAQEGLLLANLQRPKARSLQRKRATQQHPSTHPPSRLVVDRRRPSHNFWLQSPHLEPRSSQC